MRYQTENVHERFEHITDTTLNNSMLAGDVFCLLMKFANSLESYQAEQNGSALLDTLLVSLNECFEKISQF